MANGITKMSALCVAVLALPIVASGQAAEYDLILEKTFAYHVKQVGIDYNAQDGPLCTVVGSEAVEVIDSSGTTTTIESALAEHDWAKCSPKGRYIGIMRPFTEVDTLTGRPSLKYRFILRDRAGNIHGELPIAYFNTIRVSDNGWVATAVVLSFTVRDNWWLRDPSGALKGEITTPAQDIRFFGNSASFFTGPRHIAAYTGDLVQLWSFHPVSPLLQPEGMQISSDGHRFVRSSRRGLEFYEDGDLVELDTTLAGIEAEFYRVFITPDDRYALVSAGEQAHLYNLSNYQVVRTYNAAAPRVFGWGSASANADYVLLNMYVRNDTTLLQSVVLFNQAGDIVWEVEGRFEQMRVPWVSIDPQAKYIVLWDRHHLWLYEARQRER